MNKDINGWKELLKNRISGKEKNIPWLLHDKIKCNRFCQDSNIDTAKLYDIFNTPLEITFDKVDCRDFILKPTLDSSTKGVMVLRRVDRGYYDFLTKKTFSFDEIIEKQMVFFEKNKNKNNKIILEEKIIDSDFEKYDIPRDFKFFAFNGDIVAILEINRNNRPTGITWYDGDFEVMEKGIIIPNEKYVKFSYENTRPQNWEQMLESVVTISKKIRTPFARIDMYSSTRGPLLGEVTLTPGGLYYGLHYSLIDEMNLEWGRKWLTAAENLTNN